MIRFLAVVSLPLMLALGAAPASAHGCHHGYQQAPEGVHRHGQKCERQDGVSERRKSTPKAKQRSA
jgi:hypothetical protein